MRLEPEPDGPAVVHNEQKWPLPSRDHVRAVAADEASSGDSGWYLL
jgi:hypothetical protein